MKNKAIHHINGKFLYYAFIAGGKSIMEKQAELNAINVFPVRDKDTGTNLASTVRWVIDNIKPNKSYKTTVNNIAQAALIGARGNSGIIFAQFLYGLSCETKDKQAINLTEFADSVKRSIPYIYNAIGKPVEGTMLTVIKDWAAYLIRKKDSYKDFIELFTDSIEILEKSLKETTVKLKELNKYKVVDAGAKGFVLFIKGIINFLNNRNIRDLAVENIDKPTFTHTEDVSEEVLKYRYCTEAHIKDLKKSKEHINNILKKSGDSVVIAGSKSFCRIHVHTNNPAELFNELKYSGTITHQKVDDMLRQQEITRNRKWNIAIVTDSTCDLSQDIIDNYQINVVPLNLSFGESHYLDKVTIQPNQFYDLLETSNVFPSSSQINELSFTNLYSHLASHYDAIIALHVSSQFSGTYTNSLKASEKIKKEFNKDIFVIDSKNLSGALGLMVLKTAKYIEAGLSPQSIVKNINTDIANTKIFVTVKNLKYMIKSGRVSKQRGFIASTLNINPIVSMDQNGKSLLFGKTFGQKSGIKKILKHIEKISHGKEVWNYIILHAHNNKGAQDMENKMLKMTGKKAISIVDISPVIGMHAGKGAVAISLLFNK